MKTQRFHLARGFGLVELMIALAMVSIVIVGVLRIVQAAGSGFKLQKNLATLQENSRYALATLGHEILSAGFQPDPWNEVNTALAITSNATESFTSRSDRLGLSRWSQQNCFGNHNPVLGDDGQPVFFLREADFVLNSGGDLAMTCRYGPGHGALTTQLNGLGLVSGVEAFQVQYAEDSDGDGNANHWVEAGNWSNERQVQAVKLALLLRSPEAVGAPRSPAADLLGQLIVPADDGRLHRAYTAIFNIAGRRQ